MTPKELAQKHGISRGLIPAILQKSYRSVDNYLAESVEIPDSVRSQCWLISHYLEHGGSLPDLIELANRNYCEKK